MPSADFYIKQGDTSPAIEAILEDESNNPIDLTNATVRFHLKEPTSDTVKVDAAGNVIAPETDGKVRYGWQTGDTDTAGRFHAEWEVEYADGTIETFPNSDYIEVKIIEELS